MRFTLHYEGPLPANGSSASKQAVRDALEPQLKELWTYEPLVSGDLIDATKPHQKDGFSILTERHGHTFAPLVSITLGLSAELDILMLRPSSPGQIVVGGGDIDNRLKTLFDALSAPAQAQQVPPSMRHTSPTDPLYVLLDDDSLITRVNVETDRLLAPPGPDIVRLFIRVTTRITRAMWANMGI